MYWGNVSEINKKQVETYKFETYKNKIHSGEEVFFSLDKFYGNLAYLEASSDYFVRIFINNGMSCWFISRTLTSNTFTAYIGRGIVSSYTLLGSWLEFQHMH